MTTAARKPRRRVVAVYAVFSPEILVNRFGNSGRKPQLYRKCLGQARLVKVGKPATLDEKASS